MKDMANLPIRHDAELLDPSPLMPARLRQPGAPTPANTGPVQIYDARARDLLEGARLMTLYDQAGWCEGTLWLPAERTLMWSDISGRRVLGWREDGAVDVLIDATPFINGNCRAPDGTLYHCEHGRRAISRSNGDGRLHLVATHADGTRLNAPNDIIVAPDGLIWFTDPTFGIENPSQGVPASSESGRTALCRIDADGVARRVVDMVQPNGLAFSPDGRILYVSQTPLNGEGEVAIFAFDYRDGEVANQRRFATVAKGIPDGFTVDLRGWVWSVSESGIEVFDADGGHLATIPTPHFCSNCTFDEEEKRLFMAGRETLWMLPLNAT